MELLLVMWMVIANIQHKDWRKFSVKGQKANIFGLTGHKDSVPNHSVAPVPCEIGHRQNINKWVWLYSRKVLFTKTGGSRIWPVSHGLLIPGSRMPGTVLRASPGWSDFSLPMTLTGWMWVSFPFCRWEDCPRLQSRYVAGSELTSLLPTPEFCLLHFHSALYLLNPFSKLDPCSSAPWDEPFTCLVYKNGSRGGQARRCLAGRTVACRFLRSLWEQGWEIISPCVSVFSLSLIHASNKFQVWACHRPNPVNILCFSAKLWSQRSKWEAHPLGIQQRPSKKIHSLSVGTCSNPNAQSTPSTASKHLAVGSRRKPSTPQCLFNLLPKEAGLEHRSRFLAWSPSEGFEVPRRVRQQPWLTGHFPKCKAWCVFSHEKKRGTTGWWPLARQLVWLRWQEGNPKHRCHN